MKRNVLWGEDFDDYCEMFDLSTAEWGGRLLEYGSGPTAVNAACKMQGINMVSVDQLFALDTKALAAKVTPHFEAVAQDMEQHQQWFNFDNYGSFEAFLSQRRDGLAAFFMDYAGGRREARYLPNDSQSLPFENFTFDCALSAHYLFAEDSASIDFHVQQIRELLRVAKEARFYPLLDESGKPSPLLGPVLLALQQNHIGTEVREVAYQLQPKGNAMLRVWAQQCELD